MSLCDILIIDAGIKATYSELFILVTLPPKAMLPSGSRASSIS